MFKFLLILYAIFLAEALPAGPTVPSTVEEWESMVEHEISKRRESRGLPLQEDEAVYVTDLKDHYTEAFTNINDLAAVEESFYPSGREMTRERKVKARYIVFMTEESTDHHLDRVVRVLEKANRESNGHYVAKHIKKIRYVGKGFSATLSSSVVELLKKHPQSYSIESDLVIKRNNQESRYEELDEFLTQQDEESTGAKTSSGVEWNLDRIDQHDGLNGAYNPKGNGKGVDVYILDTGIRYTHDEFQGRAKYVGYDAIDELVKTNSPKKGLDCNGHGTHCAATVGGKTYGVAKGVALYSARVLDCTGTGSIGGILDAMNYIIKKRKTSGTSRRAVFSMSLGVKKNKGFNLAVNNAVKAGIVVASASGNQMSDSCMYSPGSAELSISVAASSKTDESASFSNIGLCTDIYAPGYDILSAGHDCDSCTASKSGTSMACPHVAGYAAIVLGLNGQYSPSDVKKEMIKVSSKKKINMNEMTASLATMTPNRLLYVGK
ncbi:PREDICTED: proteinase T-like [Amphimedon queenslandica]|uniref:Peptidase S8/S53 domain-containing protein n=1 Tax=Amphimedon queenslandica TaxID=400682 RepID=A0A1X7VIH9_AMPQE|nr:PREDICTED: proteinase T-like [Amphimedon queenslandica]|eukprot:XP_011410142.1 PREDICTED: proteinase T-like [Amphimedon queenslandica]